MFCRDFVNTLIAFPKTVVVAVNGPAVGFGMALLALCDVVYASDKASFSCPYTRLCQTPEACSSYTLPKILGSAMVSLACVNIGTVAKGKGETRPPASETLGPQHIGIPNFWDHGVQIVEKCTDFMMNFPNFLKVLLKPYSYFSLRHPTGWERFIDT